MPEHGGDLKQDFNAGHGLEQRRLILQLGINQFAIQPVKRFSPGRIAHPGPHTVALIEQRPDQGITQMPIGACHQT
ncbi:hypothetical protein D3C80_1486970 [compost metagenome]